MTSQRTCVYALVVFVAAASSAWADGVVRDGLGAVSSGRGGANIAHSDNGAIIHDNPAGMVNIDGCGMSEISVDLLATDLRYTDADNPGINNEFRLYPLPYFSYIQRENEDFAWGIGVFAPAGFGGDFDLVNNGITPTQNLFRYKSFAAVGKVLPGVACRLTEQLSFGATLGVGVSHAELEGPLFGQSGVLAGVPTLFDVQASGATVVWSTGLQYQLSDQTTLGLTYISESRFHLHGNARVSVFPLGESRYDAEVDMVWPQSLGLGVAHSICPHRRISADIVWYDWSSAFDAVGMKLSNPDNPMFAALGNTVQDEIPLRWEDTLVFRVGYECSLSKSAVLRTGYVYHANTIPSGTLTPYIPATLEHVFAIGYGKSFCDWNLDVAYQYTFGRDRTVGQSSLLGGDFSNSRVESQAHWLFLSASQTW